MCAQFLLYHGTIFCSFNSDAIYSFDRMHRKNCFSTKTHHTAAPEAQKLGWTETRGLGGISPQVNFNDHTLQMLGKPGKIHHTLGLPVIVIIAFQLCHISLK